MRFGAIAAVVLAAFFWTGCKRETYRTDLFYKAGGKTFAFTVTVIDRTLYVSSMVDGKTVAGSYGEMVPDGKLARVEAADLNADGEPELYAFYTRNYSWWSGLAAVSCGERECVTIGMENSADGHPPADYCGEDAYSLDKDALVRQYTVCPREEKKLGFIRYKLVKNSFGLLLKS